MQDGEYITEWLRRYSELGERLRFHSITCVCHECLLRDYAVYQWRGYKIEGL